MYSLEVLSTVLLGLDEENQLHSPYSPYKKNNSPYNSPYNGPYGPFKKTAVSLVFIVFL